MKNLARFLVAVAVFSTVVMALPTATAATNPNDADITENCDPTNTGQKITFVYAYAANRSINPASLEGYRDNTIKYFDEVLDYSSGTAFDQDWRFKCTNNVVDVRVIQTKDPSLNGDMLLDGGTNKHVLTDEEVLADVKKPVAQGGAGVNLPTIAVLWVDVTTSDCFSVNSNDPNTPANKKGCVHGGISLEKTFGIVPLYGTRPDTGPMKSEVHEITHILMDSPLHCEGDPTVRNDAGNHHINSINELMYDTGGPTHNAAAGNDRDCAVEMMGKDRIREDPGYQADPGTGLCGWVQLDCGKDDYYSVMEAVKTAFGFTPAQFNLDPLSWDPCTSTNYNHDQNGNNNGTPDDDGLCNIAESPYLMPPQQSEYDIPVCFGIAGDWGDEGADNILKTKKNVSTIDGNDTIDDRGVTRDNQFCGGDGDDTIWGGPGDDALAGNAGNDTLVGGTGFWDNIYDGPGNDTVNGGEGLHDTLYLCHDGDDSINDPDGDGPQGDPQDMAGETISNIEHVIATTVCGPENFEPHNPIIERGWFGSGI